MTSLTFFFLFIPIAVIKLVKKNAGNPSGNSKTDQYSPPAFINSILAIIQLAENIILQKINLPIGSSLFIIAAKK